jgi:hypothetical protein
LKSGRGGGFDHNFDVVTELSQANDSSAPQVVHRCAVEPCEKWKSTVSTHESWSKEHHVTIDESGTVEGCRNVGASFDEYLENSL